MVFTLSGGVRAGVSELSARGTVAGRPWRGSCIHSSSCSQAGLCQKSLEQAARLRQGPGSCTSSRVQRILNRGFWEILARGPEHLISYLHFRACHLGEHSPRGAEGGCPCSSAYCNQIGRWNRANKATWSHVGEHRTATPCPEQGKISLRK